MFETISLLPGVNLRCRKDPRFKQGCLSLHWVAPMCADRSAMNALIPSVLLRGTVPHPDLRAITARLDDLYGAAVSPMSRRVGDYQASGLYLSFMDDRFALPGDRVLEGTVDFLAELLQKPLTEDGGFLPEYVESEKKNLISTIQADRNDKRIYAMGRLLKIMCREDSFGLPRLGEPEQVAAIQPDTLYRHFRNMLESAPLEIFYVGSREGSDLADLLRSRLNLAARETTLPPQTGFHSCPGENVTETMDVAQGKLCMGFVTPITLKSPQYPAMQVLNVLYGGGMTSKLFQNVREKLSLCYSVGSSYYGSKGILTVSAGIDFDKEADAREEILRQLQLCREGTITQEDLVSAREALISSLRAVPDSAGSIESYCFTAILSGKDPSPENAIQAIRDVTLEQVVEAAKTLTLHSTYFLKGGRA